MAKLRISTLTALALVGRSKSTDGAGYAGPPFELVRVAEGVYATSFTTPEGSGLTGNAVIIVNDADVIVVDSHNTPATARAVIKEIRQITKRPVRFVINTHWHGDHIFGNQAYRDAYPGVEFIGHPYTNEDFLAEEVPGLAAYLDKGLPDEVATLTRRLASGTTSAGQPLTSQQRTRLSSAIERDRWLMRELRTVRPVLPTLTVADSLILRRGERTIAIRHLGRGNTRGDLTVHLPREGVLITGDLLVHPMPYGFGSYLGEWVDVLTKLRALPVRAVVPGHGAVQRDHQYLDRVVALLQSTLSQTRQAVAQGLDLAATRKAVNLDSFRLVFTGGDSTRNPVFDGNFTSPAVERAWLEARGELDRH